jgi:PAS domain S-box-containing protein
MAILVEQLDDSCGTDQETMTGAMLESGGRNDDWFHQVLETAPDAMVIVGSDEAIRFVNGQTERLFGYDRAQLIGQKLEALIPERLRGGHSHHVSRFFASPGTRSMGSGLELFGRRSDGSDLAIEVSLSPVHTPEGVLVSAAIRDISERKRAEALVKMAADRLTSAVESIQDAIALFDAGDLLVMCNSVFRKLHADLLPGALIGRPREDFLNAWVSELQFDSDQDRDQYRRRQERRGDRHGTFEIRVRDGRHFRVMDRPTVEGGIVRTIWDLTEDVRLSEELRAARAFAESASAAKTEFLSSMSHELRTPLNAVLGFAQLLRRDKKQPLSERHLERVSQILKGGEHLLRLIDDVLDLSRIEAGTVSLSNESVNVGEVLSEVGVTLEPMAKRHGIGLEVVAPDSPPPFVTADRVRFAQILMNFGSNAIKYNRPSGKVVFSVTNLDGGQVRVTVRDTGYGIQSDNQTKLFQPFQRAGQETGSIEGTGIGLVITKRLAELMAGRVGFESVVGAGSSFWVDLPVLDAMPKEKPSILNRLTPTPRVQSSAEHLVLYVEDNPANVLFMRDLLDSFESVELITAPTAEIGIELARAKLPQVIIMDINLPGMNGLEALQCLRDLPETKHIPVIALTAAASERDRQRGEEAGFYRYLTKPLRVDQFEAVLMELLVQD